ncbi:MAG TPA: amino acid adenylation domain-containing protein, partial [Ferruginibacter sp.]|nr:amino acid adenylation domain-containing protein [Ferruginibacter sp.]
QDKERSFDLTHDPLMRVLLFKISETEYEFIWSHHHIIMDGWCTGIVIREFSEFYESLQQGRKPRLQPVTQYREFIKWLEKREAGAASDYWKQYLEGYETRTGIGLANTQTSNGYDNCEVMTEISIEVFGQVQQLCARLKVTLNSLLQSAWAILLSRYAVKNDVVFGMVASLRPAEISGVENMVGLFINTVPVRINIDPGETFAELAKRVQKNALASERHQYYPLAEIQAGSALRQNLLDHVFVLGNYPVAEQLEGLQKEAQQEQLRITGVRAHEQVNYNFSINISAGDVLRIRYNYNGLVHSRNYIEQVAAHYSTILSEALQQPGKVLQDIKMLSGAEEDELIKIGQGPRRVYPGSIDNLFHERALLQPQAVAIADQSKSLTYAELDQLASSLALAIQEAGIEEGSHIAVKTGRSIDGVISFLGILRAGCIYIPIEPDHPNERVTNMLSAVQLKMLIATSEYLFDLPETGATVFVIDLQLNAGNADIAACRCGKASDTAYVIFTSGTTGQPKGIPVRHESIVDRSLYHIEYLQLKPQDNIMQLASVAFDASVMEICMTLLSGAKLLVPSTQAKQDPALMREYMLQQNVSVGIFPPAYLKLFDSESLPCLKQVISTGEAAILKDALSHAAVRKVHNGYGPTELCIGASFHTIDKSREAEYLACGNVPIGRPFSNTDIYVLDQNGMLCPHGVAGELCAAGIGLTKGYLGDDALTAQKFIANPYSKEQGYGRLYRTGDLVRWNDRNELEYHGRIDEQVQVRGIRVELREIEAALFKIPGVSQACVLAHTHEGNTYLVAYVTATICTDEILAYLRNKLPEYMVPA